MNAREHAEARRALNRIIGGGEIVRREQVILSGGRRLKVEALPPVDISAFGWRESETPGPDSKTISGLINREPAK